jgi:hypothetical protein
MQAGTEQNPLVRWEQCTVWMYNDPSVVRLPGWSGQFLTINNPLFPRSTRSVVRSTGRMPEKNPVAETICVGQAGRGSLYCYVYYYFYYSLALGSVLALEKLCFGLERRFCVCCLHREEMRCQQLCAALDRGSAIAFLQRMRSHLRLIHTYHAVPRRVWIVSFPFDLHSAAEFDSHMPCHDHAVLKATSPGHGTARHGHGMSCVN